MSTRVQTETETQQTPRERREDQSTPFHTLTPQGNWLNQSRRGNIEGSERNIGLEEGEAVGRTIGSTPATHNFAERPIGSVVNGSEGRDQVRHRTHRVQPQPSTPTDPVIRHIQYQSNPYAGDLLSYQIRRAEGLGSEDSFPRLGGPNILPPSLRQSVSEQGKSLERPIPRQQDQPEDNEEGDDTPQREEEPLSMNDLTRPLIEAEDLNDDNVGETNERNNTVPIHP
ncbi:hypothetical protein K435DRAFT_865774 [Dendrothele bispora CBS 962.96]|uniref:Uncharacterized protein n=1 Tax=Dendrothele bispora (strain CBS 962.96) TaxID=1314807 RepID=A0A4S8LIR9_DENBC|nr:hypothetical protein K435DRAFT_865774 [Dendrothele bispora CBS 962.96]